MDVEKIKKEFPQFVSNPDLVYLDSAASSLTPTSVLDAVDAYYCHSRANIHRGLYKEAQQATALYEEARTRVASFIGARRETVIFTPGATAGANMLFGMLEQANIFTKGDEIVTTRMDHHAMILPLQRLAERNTLKLQYIGISNSLLDEQDIREKITEKTKVVGVTLASNVLGTVNNVKDIVKRAREMGALVVVDATAAVGHVSVQVENLGADAVFFSGHKMCGPTGIGVLQVRRALLDSLSPVIVGGGIVADVGETDAMWVDDVERFEAGTPNVAGAIGLGEAAVFLEHIGVNVIHEHVKQLTEYMQKKLADVQGVKLYSAPPDENVGIVSFTLEDVHPHDIADIAGRAGVALRAGHHCALPLHRALDVSATTRASVYLYNTEEDIDAFLKSISEARSIFNL